MSFILIRMSPCLRNERTIRPASTKKKIWAIENTVCFLSLNLKALLLNLFFLLNMTQIHYISRMMGKIIGLRPVTLKKCFSKNLIDSSFKDFAFNLPLAFKTLVKS